MVKYYTCSLVANILQIILQIIELVEDIVARVLLTTISAMTLGCLRGLRRKAMIRVIKTTRHICTIARGKA